MRELEDAMTEIERARDAVEKSDIRSQLDSIGASLQEMLDTEAGNPTDAGPALGRTEFEGAAPYADHLEELESNLREQAEEAETTAVRDHLETARERIADYRNRTAEER